MGLPGSVFSGIATALESAGFKMAPNGSKQNHSNRVIHTLDVRLRSILETFGVQSKACFRLGVRNDYTPF